jgi:hypothetical protein
MDFIDRFAFIYIFGPEMDTGSVDWAQMSRLFT